MPRLIDHAFVNLKCKLNVIVPIGVFVRILHIGDVRGAEDQDERAATGPAPCRIRNLDAFIAAVGFELIYVKSGL